MSAASPLSTPPPLEPAPALRVSWAVLAWSALAVALGLGWWGGLVPVGAEDAAGFGVFLVPGTVAASAAALAVGVTGAVCAVVALGGRGGGRLVGAVAWVLAAVVLVVFVNGQLLAWLGYAMILPVLVWFQPEVGPAWVAATLTPLHLSTLFFTAGVAVWAVAGLSWRRAARGGCARCGRGPGWDADRERAVRVRALRVGRLAVALACVCALFYPALRLPWIFGVPVGMDAEEFAALAAREDMVLTGVSLGAAALVGVVLMLGLVQRWGVRFPWWMAGLRGRRVPVGLAVVPAALVAVALVAMGRSAVGELVRGPASLLTTDPVHAAAFASMAVWGAALGVAVAAYAVRRRAGCGVCGRGLPEAAPGDLPVRG
ncbi:MULTISPECIES: hypothetical protein [unclassified Nocardiopsis]|uniref:hypothetical protein n=1 Tax=unclassified Nocardiopsis TaxID=2649073 RepID=UPI001F30B186|nr:MULTISPECIES: hypothetical protein [unclassified Nocardiopsis]